ncbi:restriction endonuclease subunit S [Acetobacter cerevisiae]|uniref:restriction endonuclease subunit S n=1 Tax=Acetobacter cerevisiae TaxID=178900 RepID=UPI0020A08D42|nr:restriction endonuclease subunit S [Acetobacter cerevisiae]MCP1271276.1 restriction endonuclease subunit S [Acetobacter cerevisiae]MCP1279230.1 restriction endonuclease subunit S [Acetobacter cerevisiae]
MLPEGWKKISLADAVRQKISYGIVQAGPHVNGGVPYIKSSDVRDDISLASLQRTSTDIHRKYIRSSVHPGDIVFSLRGNIGATCIVPPEISEANLTQGTARISCSQKVYPSFLIQELRTSSCIQQALNLSKGSTFKEISLESLRTLKIILPPLPEQKKIAAILSTWDRAIEGTENLLANSQQQKKALMQQLLTGKKRLPGFTGVWKTKKLKDISKIYDGTHQTPDYVEIGVPFYSVEHLTSGNFNNTKFVSEEIYQRESKKRKIETDDILLTRIGDIGTARLIDWNVRASFYVSLALIKSSKVMSPKFFECALNSELFRRELWHRTIHVAFPKKINLGDIGDCSIHFPPLPEQEAIAAILTTADEEIASLESDLSRLRQEKKALMQQLLTGKRRVTVD